MHKCCIMYFACTVLSVLWMDVYKACIALQGIDLKMYSTNDYQVDILVEVVKVLFVYERLEQNIIFSLHWGSNSIRVPPFLFCLL